MPLTVAAPILASKLTFLKPKSKSSASYLRSSTLTSMEKTSNKSAILFTWETPFLKFGSYSDDIQHRIGKALGAMQKLNKIWSSKDVPKTTKMDIYKVLILSILLSGPETWTLKKTDENWLLIMNNGNDMF